MPSLSRRHRWQFAAAALTVAVAAVECRGIEMFTYYGDGSRIGLPSLEVPIEAYPGIPLRSDRIRARRRAQRMGPGGAVRVGPPGYARGITIRAMPPVAEQAAPARAMSPRAIPQIEPSLDIAPEPAPITPREKNQGEKNHGEKNQGGAEKIPAPAPED